MPIDMHPSTQAKTIAHALIHGHTEITALEAAGYSNRDAIRYAPLITLAIHDAIKHCKRG